MAHAICASGAWLILPAASLAEIHRRKLRPVSWAPLLFNASVRGSSMRSGSRARSARAGCSSEPRRDGANERGPTMPGPDPDSFLNQCQVKTRALSGLMALFVHACYPDPIVSFQTWFRLKPDCRTKQNERPSPSFAATINCHHQFRVPNTPTPTPLAQRWGRHGDVTGIHHLTRTLSSSMAVARLRSAAARLRPALIAGRRERRLLGTAAAEIAEVGAAAPMATGVARWEPMGAREYYDYRRAIYGDITHKAILVDAAGTLLAPTEPMAQVYRTIGQKYGVEYSEDEILHRYRRAYSQPWGRSRLRYVNDGRPFWQYIVSSSTGCSDLKYFEEVYNYYTTEKAWHLCDPDAGRVFQALRRAGVKTAVVSNFDTRLRPLLRALKCDHWFDAVAISAEVAAEKPNPTIFLKACELLGVKPEEAVHIGDDRRNDLWGARDAGCDAWLWGSDVYSFKEIAERIGVDV